MNCRGQAGNCTVAAQVESVLEAELAVEDVDPVVGAKMQEHARRPDRRQGLSFVKPEVTPGEPLAVGDRVVPGVRADAKAAST